MPNDPWTWLLGRTASGLWRHVPYQASDLGQGQDPNHEPRVEVLRRLIAYPAGSFARVLATVSALEEGATPVRWLCYREPGTSPARPYWLAFVSSRPGGRRFHFGLELFDRDKLGLWFFSGYDAVSVPPSLLAPFPSRPDVSLPRIELSDATLALHPIDAWIGAAWAGTLQFEPGAAATPTAGSSADQSVLLDASIQLLLEEINPPPHLSLRAARARLVVRVPDDPNPVKLYPLARLSTLIGRDPRCNIPLDDPTASNEHCRIVWREGVPLIEDLGSKNGTTVGGQPLIANTPTPLPPESQVEIGSLLALFVQDLPDEDGDARTRLHAARVNALVSTGELTAEQAEKVFRDAEETGITPGEILLKQGRVPLESWAQVKKSGGCALLFLLLPLLLLMSGCTSFGIPPFYEQDFEPQPERKGQRRVQWDFDVGLRPLLNVRGQEETGRSEVNFLFPLGRYEADDDAFDIRLYPIFQHRERVDPDGFEDTDTILFPLLFTGTHPVEGRYLYLFPLGGTLKGKLGKDEIVGVLWPLYAWTRDRETETHHVLWPLFSVTNGPRSSGLRVWPFYQHQEKRDEEGEVVFNRTTVLWPFLHWADENTNSRNRFSAFFFFPFFGWIRSGMVDDTVVLWPLFRWWHDKRTGYEEVRAPFPFVIYGSGPDHSRFDLWPLFGFRERGDYRRHFFLWPIERYERQETEEYVDTRLWVLPLFWQHHRVYKGPDGVADPVHGEDRKVTVFPLFRYEARKDGFREVRIPAPLWFPDPLQDFAAFLAPFWRLYRYRDDGQGNKRVDLLFGLWRARATPTEEEWDVLGGLVGYRTGPEGGKVQLLWLLEF